MGNAPICQACGTDKGVRVQGNVQDADKIPDYYGCNNGMNKDSEGLVSLKRKHSWENKELVIKR